MSPVSQNFPHPQRAFTLAELIATVLVIAVIGLVVVPSFVNHSSAPGLKAAANMLAADIEFAEGDSITHPSTLRQIQFDTVNNRYWLAATATPSTPLTHPLDGQPYLNDFATGRSSQLAGVALSAVTLTPSGSILQFDAYGRPVGQTANAVIQLAATNGATFTVTINATTGETSITSP